MAKVAAKAKDRPVKKKQTVGMKILTPSRAMRQSAVQSLNFRMQTVFRAFKAI